MLVKKMRFELNHLSGPDMSKHHDSFKWSCQITMWWLCEKWDANVKWLTFPASEGGLACLASKENQYLLAFLNELSQAKLGQAQIMHPSLLGQAPVKLEKPSSTSLTEAHEPGLGLRSNQALNKPSSIQAEPYRLLLKLMSLWVGSAHWHP